MNVHQRISLFLSILLFILAPAAQPADVMRSPTWDRELAIETARLGGDESPLREWFEMLRAGDHARLLQALKAYSRASAVTAPIRERQLLLFTLELADFPAGAVPATVLEFLASYSPQVLVPHEEAPDFAVPLFNVPSAALGVENSMDRRRGEVRATALLEREPGTWVQAYLDGSIAERRGFVDALAAASGQQRRAIGRLALQSVESEPGLLAVAGVTALASADREAIESIVQRGRGAEVTALLRGAPGYLSTSDQALVLLSAIEYAPAENAAVAIAVLAPGLHDFPEITATLFELLEDDWLGSAAALALARHPDPAVARRLVQVGGGKSPAAQRARMVLEMSRDGALVATEPGRSPGVEQ